MFYLLLQFFIKCVISFVVLMVAKLLQTDYIDNLINETFLTTQIALFAISASLYTFIVSQIISIGEKSTDKEQKSKFFKSTSSSLQESLTEQMFYMIITFVSILLSSNKNILIISALEDYIVIVAITLKILTIASFLSSIHCVFDVSKSMFSFINEDIE